MKRKYSPYTETEKQSLLREMKQHVFLIEKTIKKIEAGGDVNAVLSAFQRELFKKMTPLEQAMHVSETHPNARASIVMPVDN